jgi:hypothetical protein
VGPKHTSIKVDLTLLTSRRAAQFQTTEAAGGVIPLWTIADLMPLPAQVSYILNPNVMLALAMAGYSGPKDDKEDKGIRRSSATSLAKPAFNEVN